MFLRRNFILKSVFVVVFFSSFSFAKESLIIMTENWPPLNYVENGILKGPAVDIVRAIQNKIKNENKILVLPWKRAYKYTLSEKNIILFSMVHSKKRKKLFKWVGPIAVKKYSLYAKKDFKANINNLDDARQFSVGVQRGGITEEILKTNAFLKLVQLSNANQNARMVLRDRIDLMFDSESTYLNTIKEFKLNKNDFKKVFVVKKSFLYIAFNKRTDESILLAWQKAYDELYEEGIIKEIYLKHDLLSLYVSSNS